MQLIQQNQLITDYEDISLMAKLITAISST